MKISLTNWNEMTICIACFKHIQQKCVSRGFIRKGDKLSAEGEPKHAVRGGIAERLCLCKIEEYTNPRQHLQR